MDTTSEQIEFQNKFADEVCRLAEDARRRGMSEQMQALILLDLSTESAMQGDPLVLFDHTLWMQSRGKELLQEFEDRFRDKLDFDALIQGRVEPKKDRALH